MKLPNLEHFSFQHQRCQFVENFGDYQICSISDFNTTEVIFQIILWVTKFGALQISTLDFAKTFGDYQILSSSDFDTTHTEVKKILRAYFWNLSNFNTTLKYLINDHAHLISFNIFSTLLINFHVVNCNFFQPAHNFSYTK